MLFTVLVDAGLPREVGPVAAMLADHDQGRADTRQMRAAAERLGAGDVNACGEVVANALGYVDLLRQHIGKEDHVLFPMADEMIPLAEQSALTDRFEMHRARRDRRGRSREVSCAG